MSKKRFIYYSALVLKITLGIEMPENNDILDLLRKQQKGTIKKSSVKKRIQATEDEIDLGEENLSKIKRDDLALYYHLRKEIMENRLILLKIMEKVS